MPNDLIEAENRKWRHLVVENDQDWALEMSKNPLYKRQDIDNFIIKKYWDLAYQFTWLTLSDNERLQEKFKYRSKPRNVGYYEEFNTDK